MGFENTIKKEDAKKYLLPQLKKPDTEQNSHLRQKENGKPIDDKEFKIASELIFDHFVPALEEHFNHNGYIDERTYFETYYRAFSKDNKGSSTSNITFIDEETGKEMEFDTTGHLKFISDTVRERFPEFILDSSSLKKELEDLMKKHPELERVGRNDFRKAGLETMEEFESNMETFKQLQELDPGTNFMIVKPPKLEDESGIDKELIDKYHQLILGINDNLDIMVRKWGSLEASLFDICNNAFEKTLELVGAVGPSKADRNKCLS